MTKDQNFSHPLFDEPESISMTTSELMGLNKLKLDSNKNNENVTSDVNVLYQGWELCFVFGKFPNQS